MLGVCGAAILSALITIYITPFVRAWALRRSVVDMPSERRINKEPMPRTGGIAIFVGFLVAAIGAVLARQLRLPSSPIWTPQVTGFLLATTFIAFLGLVDDIKNLSPKLQIGAMIGGALLLCAFGVRIEGVANPLSGKWVPLPIGLSLFLTVFWVMVVTKTVDAIDGLDGLASGVSALCAMTLALMATQLKSVESATIALLAAALAGACLGFLRHNYHPAKIIMGTMGAWVLGFTLAAISIMGAFKVAATVSVAIPVLVLGVPIFDFTHVVARRALDGAPLTQADKRHLHHRLLARGMTQVQVAWTIYGITFLFCATALLLFQFGRR